MIQDTQAQIASVQKELMEILSSFTQDNINTVPFEGSWTAAQVGDHIMKYGAWLLGTVTGPSKPAERAPDAKSQGIRDIFLNFELKFQSPDFIIPTNEPLDRKHLINILDTMATHLHDAAAEHDITALCTSNELPTVGLLTRLEWFDFFVTHTQRHIHQLKNIYAKLA